MKEVPFSTVLAALNDLGRPFSARYVERFSDLHPADLNALMQFWPRLPLTRKHSLLKQLVDSYQDDTLLSFDGLATRLLDDADGQVRLYALQLLSETGDSHLIPRLIAMVSNDPEPVARAQAATLLGMFVEMGELEELPADKLDVVVNALLPIAADPDGHIARAALESLGYSSRPEIEALIETAFKHHDPHWQASALKAAGRSADNRWQEQVMAALSSEDQPMRLAAVEAAGELELKPARQSLLGMIDDEDDDEVLQAIIWSLSLIGGEDVRTYIQTLLDDTDDDDMIEFLEDALLNLSFTEDDGGFDLFAFDEDEPVSKKKKH